MDAKALYPDKSVRHAVMTVQLPRMEGHQKLQADVVNGEGVPAAAGAGYAPVPQLSVSVVLQLAGGQTRTVQVDLPAVVRDPKSATKGLWLDGPLAQERRYRANVDDRLQIVFDVFTPKVGPARVDVAFHNDWNTVKSGEDVVYDVDIRLDGATAYKAQGVRHYPRSNWHQVIWTDNLPPVRAALDLSEMQAAAAVPRYDRAFRVDPELSGRLDAAARELSDAPLDPALIAKHMPMTGGRMDIGPLPTWTVVDLLQGDAATRKVMLANADAAGAVPWHIREKGAEQALSMDKYPHLWLDNRGTRNEPLAQPFESENNEWRLDAAHQPSLSYVPYLVTGLQYYRDELTQQAAYVLLSYDDGYRGYADGLIIGSEGQAWQQVRGMAWSLRTVANAAYILPADDPMQAYFDAKLRGNLAKLAELYVDGRKLKAAGELEGWLPGVYRPDNAVAPWQQGFLGMSLGWINDMGYTDAGRVLSWMSNFLAGLFTSGAKGFDPSFGPAYILSVRDEKSEKEISTWREAFLASGFVDKSPNEKREYWHFYGMIMRAALGSAYGVEPAPRTKAAYDYVSNTLGADTAGGDPTFVIVPAKAAPAAP
jgi:hypothetical protein